MPNIKKTSAYYITLLQITPELFLDNSTFAHRNMKTVLDITR